MFSMKIPKMLLRQIYTFNSLKNVVNGIQFAIKNRLTDVEFMEVISIKINGKEIPKEQITLDWGDGKIIPANEINEQSSISFPLRQVVLVTCQTENLPHGKHKLEIAFRVKDYGVLEFDVE
ncbi:MAG: hydroxymethylglutaryl-CoA reductase, partial [Acidobacteria bacterium]